MTDFVLIRHGQCVAESPGLLPQAVSLGSSPVVVISPRLWPRRDPLPLTLSQWRRLDKKRTIAKKQRNIILRIP